MEVITHLLPGLLEFRPRIFGDPRGAFFESFSARTMEGPGPAAPPLGAGQPEQFPRLARCAGCTSSARPTPRPSWCAWPRAAPSTWWWTCATARTTFGQHAQSGADPPRWATCSTCPKASPTASWRSKTRRSFSTNARTTTPPPPRAACAGTTPPWASAWQLRGRGPGVGERCGFAHAGRAGKPVLDQLSVINYQVGSAGQLLLSWQNSEQLMIDN